MENENTNLETNTEAEANTEVKANTEAEANTETEATAETNEPYKVHGVRYFIGGALAGVSCAAVVGAIAFTAYSLNQKAASQSANNESANQQEVNEVVENSEDAAEKNETETSINGESVYKLQLLENAINKYYYESEDVTVEQKEEGMYKGLINSLGDPYSNYFTEQEMEELSADMKGVFYGIGVYFGIDKTTQMPMLSGILPGTPAEKAELRAGDIIYKIDGEKTAGMTSDDVVNLVHGEKGTTVHLTIFREGETDYLEKDIVRDEVDVTTVVSEMKENQIGYIGIASFDEVTIQQFTDALTDLKSQGMKALIVDLRGDTGGSVTTVTDIARQLLPEGLIFYTEDKDGKRQDYTCDGSGELKIPMVVLVNGYSASASEILAGALQDSGVATVIGTQTYGKGVVQTVFSLTDGSAVKLTVANYFTRNGHNINQIGITPDIVCEFESEKYYEEDYDNQLEKALEVLGEELEEKAS